VSYRLNINTGFAVNRYSEPEDWVKIVGKDLGLRYVQLTADILNPSLPDSIIQNYIERTRVACADYDVTINSTFTGAFTRVNHLAHPNKQVQLYWIEWFKRYVDITVALGASSMGSHFGIFTAADNNDLVKRSERRQQNIENWHDIGKYAVKKGLKFLTWEPMSIKREQGETLTECQLLQQAVNKNAPLPFRLCLDVDHGDVCSMNPEDTNPYAWLRQFGKESPLIHLKQTTTNKGGHWPFTADYNKVGKITPEKVINVLQEISVYDADLILELSFKEREPIDSTVIPVLQESVAYWRQVVTE
jgi:sugar phosphate isomerase/epimerase